jgi:hypothetical protein
LARAIAAGPKVVKAFNTTFAGTLIAGEVAGQKLDVFTTVYMPIKLTVDKNKWKEIKFTGCP